jgi:hypothetical protein
MNESDERIKEPEIIPLPEVRGVQQQVAGFEEPYFVALEREKQQNKTAFENSRRNARVERIKAIQSLRRSSKVVVYYSVDLLTATDAEFLFDLLQSVGKQKRLDLFLLSPGGYADPAFKMACLCRDFTEENFGVIVPHYAKSAATLLCLGSDEIVMGPASEIGPTDPRIEIKDEYGRKINVSATSVEDALKVIEQYAGGDPMKSLKYMPLIERINLNTLGEYRRALLSSEQYAEELLRSGNLLKEKKSYKSVASKLATKYYSHGYPIKLDAARSELKLNVTEAEQQLWRAIWQLHKLYDVMIKDSRDGKSMITTIFEAEDFLMPIIKPLTSDDQQLREKRREQA